jgi:membrane-bound lytic murein transglycosylase B
MTMVAFSASVRAQSHASPEAADFFESLWPAAQKNGISRALFERTIAGFVVDPDVLDLATRQPEHMKSTGAYVMDVVTPARTDAGRAKAVEHANSLAAIERTYGVDRHILLGIWGVESAYGTAKGSRSVVRSLATLAMADARRAAFWKKELLAALRILQDGAAAPEALVGSWAGAMGHTQFIPSTYAAHAVDFDKDGRRDIWSTAADALASTASYLKAAGWSAGVPWGWEVILPPGFDYAWSAPGRPRPLADWQADGVKAAGARRDPPAGVTLQLILPAGARGPAFLVTGNFRALMRYNQSTAYALAVGLLADGIGGRGGLATPWPAADKPLTKAEREELQGALSWWGQDTGGRDGIIGDRTRAAIRAAQRTLDLTEDGHPTPELLLHLRSSGGP